MDQNDISQMELHKWSGVSRPTITKLCADKDYEPKDLTKRSIISALQRHGFDVYEEDFWN
jgi:DNA-binding XRE family transcriptional regulator